MLKFYPPLSLLLLAFTFFLTSYSPTNACNFTSLALDSVEADTGGTYIIWMTFCVGGGYDGSVFGADSETEQFWFEIYPDPLSPGDTIVDQYTAGYAFPETLCSGQEVEDFNAPFSTPDCPRCNCAIAKKGLLGYFYRFGVCDIFGTGCPRHTVAPVACPGGAGTCIDYTPNHSVANGFGYDTSVPNTTQMGICSAAMCPGPTLGVAYKLYTSIATTSGDAKAYCDTMYIRTIGIPDSVRVWELETNGAVTTPGSKNGKCTLATDLLIDLSTLGVEVMFFNAQEEGNVISLNWESDLEPFNDYFLVEKAFAGGQFIEIGLVQSAEHTFRKNNYNLIDAHPIHGDNLYKLYSVNLNGTKQELGEVTVFYSGENSTYLVGQGPVPATDFVNLELFSDKIQSAKLKLIDLQGKVLSSNEVQLEAGLNQIKVPLNQHAQGIYNIYISNSDFEIRSKILKR